MKPRADWRRTSEELPDHEGEVLCYDATVGSYSVLICHNGNFLYEDSGEEGSPTHWTELPEKP